MAYLLRRTRHGTDLVTVLCEAPEKEVRPLIKQNSDDIGYRRVDAKFARDWVASGFQHETALYLDGKTVRRAKG